MERVNSAATLMGDPAMPGVQTIIRRLRDESSDYTPEELVDSCLTLCGTEAAVSTRSELVAYVSEQGGLRFDSQISGGCAEQRVADLLQLIVSTREYQMA